MKIKLIASASWCLALMTFGIISLSSCKDEENGSSYNPSVPVEITKLDPEVGGSGTQCLIYGKNFGTDLSQIEVTFNGKKAVVINTKEDCIYCAVPVRAGSGPIKVKIGNGEQAQECTAEKEFKYEFVTKVGTLAGWMDKDYKSEIKDGLLEEAGFEEPYRMLIDKKTSDLIILENRKCVRRIDLKKGVVETLFHLPQTVVQPRQISFSPSCDTLFINNDQGDVNGIAVAIALRSEDFRKVHPFIESDSSTGGSCHPINKDYFFTKWNDGDIFQWDFETGAKRVFDEKGNTSIKKLAGGLIANIIFAPSGKFAYIVSENHEIYKCEYNFTTRCLENFIDFCGQRGDSNKGSTVDDFGTKARFNKPQQGCFDEYDNFYLCENESHCIRKIEPSGRVTTYAGKVNTWGYADGDLRKEAMFNRPHGIVYDSVNKIFYVADMGNRRIRTIQEE